MATVFGNGLDIEDLNAESDEMLDFVSIAL